MTPERLAALRFQRDHNGFNEAYYNTLVKTNRPVDLPHATMIQITPAELREFLSHYPETDDVTTPEGPVDGSGEASNS
jgi:hypothetical protein